LVGCRPGAVVAAACGALMLRQVSSIEKECRYQWREAGRAHQCRVASDTYLDRLAVANAQRAVLAALDALEQLDGLVLPRVS
jgi:hypothetical protein